VRAPENDEFVYELPFEAGKAVSVVQGYGGTYSHTGESYFSIDFSMPENTPICAVRSGVVYHVIDHFSEGGAHVSFKPKANAIYVLHADDTIAAYVHLMHSGACVRAGDFVSAGQMIGLSGNTGWSGSPHLHFHVSDAFYHRRIPTTFNTVEEGVTIVEGGRSYTRPVSGESSRTHTDRSDFDVSHHQTIEDRDAFVFCPELLNLCTELVPELSAVGFETTADYSSIEAMHDVHGIEVCGIRHPETALRITRYLLRRFPGWNADWLHPPDGSSSEGWVARIQRDRDQAIEYWDTD
jgi:murein DD-endopeptidase MepM/ murein hydrolase activator NlpD